MIVYGKQTVQYLIEETNYAIEEVYVTKKLDKKLFSKLKAKNVYVKTVDNRTAQGLARGGNHQGILAKIAPFDPTPFETIKNSEFLLFLDAISDVGNIGAIVRTAYALGVDAVIISGIKDPKYEAIARTSSGALFSLSVVHVNDGLSAINELKQIGFTFYGASLDGEDIRQSTIESKRVLVLGSEGDGLSKRVQKALDHEVKIIMPRSFDSLNVSAAAAILIDRMR
jgi:23S rRNA (guanosine2251-2'-O)-methyltransferase